MSANTKIEWCDHTWSPVWGCTEISKAETGGGGCDNCYARVLANRFGTGWNGAPMREFGEHHWNEPVRWNRKAAAAGTTPRVFPSMCDPFDKNWPAGVRTRFFELIERTPNLIWLLLTKRIGNVARMLEEQGLSSLPSNVWLGATIVNREELLRDGPKLMQVPARVRFWSAEPLLGDLGEIPLNIMPDWIIVGGESGPGARPMHPDWARSLRDQCEAAGVPFLLKQHGEYIECDAYVDAGGERGHQHVVEVDDGYGVELGNRGYSVIQAHGTQFVRIGKKATGRLLDGREWNGVPA